MTKDDPVNNPSHYTGRIEVIDFMEEYLTPEEFKGFLKGNIIKYISRATRKGNEQQDYAKARWYLNRLCK